MLNDDGQEQLEYYERAQKEIEKLMKRYRDREEQIDNEEIVKQINE